jgi:hypothetical protein
MNNIKNNDINNTCKHAVILSLLPKQQELSRSQLSDHTFSQSIELKLFQRKCENVDIYITNFITMNRNIFKEYSF